MNSSRGFIGEVQALGGVLHPHWVSSGRRRHALKKTGRNERGPGCGRIVCDAALICRLTSLREEREADDEQDRDDQGGRVDGAPFAGEGLQHHIAD